MEGRKRTREWLFCDHCDQLLPKSTYYRHKDLELENHTDSEVFDVFNADESAPSFSDNDSLVVEELSPVQPPEAELVDETRVIV